MARKLIFIVIILIVGVFLTINWVAPQQLEPKKPIVNGVAAVGGNFALIDHHNKPFTQEKLKGKYSLVFFGFTNCPDICPTSLLTISNMLETLGEKSNQLQTLFISVDPKRDTPDILAKYVSNFEGNIIGLTGSSEEVKNVSNAYRVYYSKVESEEESGMGYLMDHSAYIFLMDKKSRYITHFPSNITEQMLLEKINQEIRS